MHKFISEQPASVDELQARLHKMADKELRAFGLAAAYMCSEKANRGKPPLVAFDIQLEAARIEWKRRRDEKKRDRKR